MLQRIQSVFLLLASAAMLVASVTTLATFRYNGELVTFEAMGMYLNGNMTDSTWGLFALGAVSSVLGLIIVFLFKNRVLQMRLTLMNIFIMIGFYLFFGFLVYKTNSTAELTFEKIGVGLIMPIIAIILSWLAIRKIGEDETLVRSLDRLR